MSGAQLVDRLEQRDEADHRRACIRINETGLPGEHDGGQDIVRALGHGHDAGLDGAGAVALDGLAGGHEGSVGRQGGGIQGWGSGSERAPGEELGGEQLSACIGVQRDEVDCAGEAPEELADGLPVLGRVLAQVEGGQGQADRGDDAQRPVDHTDGRDRVVRRERGTDLHEVIEEFACASVVAPGHVRPARADALAGEAKPVVDDGEFQAHRLLGVEAQESPVEFGQVLQVAIDCGAQVGIRS